MIVTQTCKKVYKLPIKTEKKHLTDKYIKDNPKEKQNENFSRNMLAPCTVNNVYKKRVKTVKSKLK